METSSSTSHFKRALTRLLLPVLGAIAALCFAVDRLFFTQVILKNTTAGSYKTYRIFHETKPDEIPIFGSSRAAGSYVSEEIDPRPPVGIVPKDRLAPITARRHVIHTPCKLDSQRPRHDALPEKKSAKYAFAISSLQTTPGPLDTG